MTESQHTEWMETWRDDTLRSVCGFANAEGSLLIIGRNDNCDSVDVGDSVSPHVTPHVTDPVTDPVPLPVGEPSPDLIQRGSTP